MEMKMAETAQIRWPGMYARAVCAMKRRSRDGIRSLQAEVIMPGYIFFRADEDCVPMPPLPEGMLRILTTVDGDYALCGQDAWFAQWLLDQHGIIGVSAAHWVDERVHIVQGPLKDLEGNIVRIDKRNHNAQVELRVNDCRVKAWLPFEIIESRDKKTGDERDATGKRIQNH